MERNNNIQGQSVTLMASQRGNVEVTGQCLFPLVYLWGFVALNSTLGHISPSRRSGYLRKAHASRVDHKISIRGEVRFDPINTVSDNFKEKDCFFSPISRISKQLLQNTK